MRKLLFLLAVMFGGAFFMQSPAHALSLKVAPLEYRTTLKKGEVKKGFVDVSNPTDKSVIVTSSAQAFKQIDNEGTLQFYDNEQVKAGVKLDLDEFELGPKEAVRMYFLLDSTKLPSGDVFAAIFFTTRASKVENGVGQAVKLGTLLSIVNGAPGSRQAEITELKLPWLQFASEVRGMYKIKNTADPQTASGFYPEVEVQTSPFGEKKHTTSKLVFAGITRENEFTAKLPPLGVYYVQVGYGNSVKSQWVAVISPLALLVILGMVIALYTVKKLRRYRREKSSVSGLNIRG